MTMVSFRVDDAEVAEMQRWAQQLGVGRSELLREALHRYLVGLESVLDVDRWEAEPLAAAESAFAEVADWGPAEDWSDWADETR